VTPLEFRRDLWHWKTKDPGLLYGIVRVILCLVILVEYGLVTDRQTDRHRMMASTVSPPVYITLSTIDCSKSAHMSASVVMETAGGSQQH